MRFTPGPSWPSMLAVTALALPWLLPISAVPDTVLYSQLAAVVGWSLWINLLAMDRFARGAPQLGPLLAMVSVLSALMLLSGLQWQFTAVLALASAVAILWSAASAPESAHPPVAIALWLSGLGSCAVAVVQYVFPSFADNLLIAASTAGGRAVGNMRQPNHLATALLCAMVWTAWLWQAGHLGRRTALMSMMAMVLGVVLSASRTGALSLVVLLAWAVADRSLPRAARAALSATPLAYLAGWAALAAYASVEQTQFYGAERLGSHADISSSRFAIWKNSFDLIVENPWAGVGWGNFNFAWTFSPFPDRPVAFFDHTHNVMLQFAVETGVPATVAVAVILVAALWRARSSFALPNSRDGVPRATPHRAALAMLVVLLVHSQLEYPLWYPYFLLPAAWALGLCVSMPTAGAATLNCDTSVGRAETVVLRIACLAMMAGAVYAAWDHRRIEVIFAPPPNAPPLEARVADGQRSFLFAHHADYAAATTWPLAVPLNTFREPLHQLVDIRLLISYIEALRAHGREREALYAAQRLREFRRPDAQAYFKDCAGPAPPFQCDTRPVSGLTWRDLDP